MKKLLIIAICLFGLSPFLKAQMLNLNYQISLPINSLSVQLLAGMSFTKIKNTLPEISDSMEIVMYIRLPGISIVISIRCLC